MNLNIFNFLIIGMVYLPPELGWATTVMTYTTVSRALPWQGHVYIKISRSISNSIAISFLGHILGQKGGWARPVPGTMDGAPLAWSIQLEIKKWIHVVIEVRDSPHGILDSWARWTRALPRFQSCWDVAVAATVIWPFLGGLPPAQTPPL